MSNDVIVTLRDLGRFRKDLDEITENALAVDLVLDHNGQTNIKELRAAIGLCIMRIKQLSQGMSNLVEEAISE